MVCYVNAVHEYVAAGRINVQAMACVHIFTVCGQTASLHTSVKWTNSTYLQKIS